MNKLALGLAVLALLGVGVLWLGHPPVDLGRGGNEEFTLQNYYNGISLGPRGGLGASNVKMVGANCISRALNLPAIVAGATSTFTFQLAGARIAVGNSTSTQVFNASVATTSAFTWGLRLHAVVTSTNGWVQVTARNDGAGFAATAIPVNVCFLEFATSSDAF